MNDVYHAGELAVQRRAGVEVRARNVGRIILPGLPEGADGFLAGLPMLLRGGVDGDGRVWATALAGVPGFIRAEDSQTVTVRAYPRPDDPLSHDAGALPSGFLAIDLATRQRLRFNGETRREKDALIVKVDQAYGNCPKYIQRREVTAHEEPGEPPRAERNPRLSDSDRDLIQRADTFFIASVAEGHGADVSHRGGLPGFVRVSPAGSLAFRDYPGNRMFQTLGNLTADPRAGLFFMDFQTGTTLQLSGLAEVLWDDEPTGDPVDTGRAVRFEPREVVRTPGGLPLRWVLRTYSPYNPEEK